MKAMMLSLPPEGCLELLAGRCGTLWSKYKPSEKPPFKCYIYCTKQNKKELQRRFAVYNYQDRSIYEGNGMVVGEMWCTGLQEYNYTKHLCGLIVSNIIFYDKPRELNEFKKYYRKCYYALMGLDNKPVCEVCARCNVNKPPQTWCYVKRKNEELHSSGYISVLYKDVWVVNNRVDTFLIECYAPHPVIDKVYSCYEE